MADGLCVEYPLVSFFPERGESTVEAKEVCSRCLVKDECLQAALEQVERHGIWGGLSERERRRVRFDRNLAKRRQRGGKPSPKSHLEQQLRDERRLLIGVLREMGVAAKVIAAAAGISAGTISGELGALGRQMRQ